MMLFGWDFLFDLFCARFWRWSRFGFYSIKAIEPLTDGAVVGNDQCSKCSRFLSHHSASGNLCSFHNVVWTRHNDREPSQPYSLFRETFEMWLRSRCGGDEDESLIRRDLSTLESFLKFAVHSRSRSSDGVNMYDFCEEAFCDYQLVHAFLHHSDEQRRSASDLLNIAVALHQFVEFRKFQLPIKGIIENKYEATERLLTMYRASLESGSTHTLLPPVTIVTKADTEQTVLHFLPQYQVIIDLFTRCTDKRSLENGSDLDFATSFVSLYLYNCLPSHVEYLHWVQVDDLYDHTGADDFKSRTRVNTCSEPLFLTATLRLNIGRNQPPPSVALACISQLQVLMSQQNECSEIIKKYVEYIRPRLSRANNYLLLDRFGLGLTYREIESRITLLVYRVTGLRTSLCSELQLPTVLRPSPASKRRASLLSSSLASQICPSSLKRPSHRSRSAAQDGSMPFGSAPLPKRFLSFFNASDVKKHKRRTFANGQICRKIMRGYAKKRMEKLRKR